MPGVNAEAGRALEVQGQPGLHSKFQAIKGCTVGTQTKRKEEKIGVLS